MRKFLVWLLIVSMLMVGNVVLAESSAITAINGEKAVRTSSDLYIVVSNNGMDDLIRISSSGVAASVDRADKIDALVPYAGGAAYLKTDGNASSIILCSGTTRSVMYKFEGMTCEKLNAYGDDLLVLSDGLLYRVDPNDQVCLKLSGAQMLDYCVSGGYAYYLSATDMMQYSADITENGETVTVTADVGCIYRLDLTNGETMLMLKSGGTDMKIRNNDLYFHSLQQVYAVRSENGYSLRGRLFNLDVVEKKLNSVCSAEDIDYWTVDAGAVAWYDGALNLLGNESRELYRPADGAQVVSDGTRLYAWESGAKTLTRIETTGLTEVIYTGDISKLADIAAATATPTAEPTAEPTPIPTPEPVAEDVFAAEEEGTEPAPEATPLDSEGSVFADGNTGSTEWFDSFLNESQNVEANPTPIGAEATPEPETEGTEQAAAPSITPVPDSGLETFAVKGSSVVIVDSSANMRIGPGTNYEKMGSIPQGKRVQYMGIASKSTVNGTTWYKVYYNGLTGWVSSMYAKVSSEQAAGAKPSGANASYATETMSGKYVRITGGYVNMRSGPSQSYSVVTVLPEGAYVEFAGKTAKDERGVKWYQLSYNGKTGWISSRMGEVTESKSSSASGTSSSSSSSSASGKVKTTGNVTIRKSADKNSTRLGYIPSGVSVTYLGSSKTDSRGVRWYKIKYNGVTGWISSRYSKLK